MFQNQKYKKYTEHFEYHQVTFVAAHHWKRSRILSNFWEKTKTATPSFRTSIFGNKSEKHDL